MNDLTRVGAEEGFGTFKVLADALPYLVMYVDNREVCRAHNVAVENMLGLSADQIDGRTLREIAGIASYECIRTWVVRALAGEQVFLRQVHRTADGKVVSFEARYAPHIAPDGRVLGFCALLTPASANSESRPDARPSISESDAQAEEATVTAESSGDDSAEFDAAKRDRALLRITSALQGNRFFLFQQPIVSIASPPTPHRSFEVLLRLRDKDDRLIHPGAFLQEAEETGCMVELDRLVIDRVVNWYASQRTLGATTPIRCHINLSMSSIRDGSFPADLRQVIHSHSLPPSMLCFEISESDLAGHRLEVMSGMQALRILGCRVGLDRVNGVSGAFSALLDLPIDFVKIDGSIVSGMRTDSRNRAKARIIARIAETARLEAIAERVEDGETIEVLRTLGIDAVQGYGVSMPEPLA